MKIVTNGKGLFAIRSGVWPFYRYLDLEDNRFWWKKDSRFYIDCWGELAVVDKWFGLLNPKVYKHNEMSEIDRQLNKMDDLN